MIDKNTDFSMDACVQDLIQCTGDELVRRYGSKYIEYRNFQVMDKVMKRYAKELAAVTRNGYAREFFLARIIMIYVCVDLEDPIYQTGANAYSFLADLYWLSNDINPLKYNYPAEMLMGEKLNRRPLFSFVVHYGVREYIIDHLQYLFGEENVSEPDENTIRVKWPSDENASDQLDDEVDIMILERHLIMMADLLSFDGVKDYEAGSHCMNAIDDICAQAFGIGSELYDETLPEDRMKHVRAVLSDLMDIMAAEPSEGIEEDLLTNREAFLDTCLDGTLRGVARAIAVMHGRGLWKTEHVLCEFRDELKKKSFDRMVCSRDDILELCDYVIRDIDRSFFVADRISKGMGKMQDVQEILRKENAPAWLYTLAENVEYTVTEGGCMHYAKVLLYLAFEREMNQAKYETRLSERIEAAQVRSKMNVILEKRKLSSDLRDAGNYEEAFEIDRELYKRTDPFKLEIGTSFWRNIGLDVITDLFYLKEYKRVEELGDILLWNWQRYGLNDEVETLKAMYMIMISLFYEKKYKRSYSIGEEFVGRGARVFGDDDELVQKARGRLQLCWMIIEGEKTSDDFEEFVDENGELPFH